MHNVLKSWAVPKGMPLDKHETHSAFETEDHPIEYLEFEGVIPEGEYGGGTIMVWDLGTFEIVDGNYWKGRLSVFLKGTKLKGEWTLERAGDENGKPRWSLRKTGKNAQRIPARRSDSSALSGRTMDEIAGKSPETRKQNRRAAISAQRKSAKTKPVAAPRFVRPMKATAVRELPHGDEWIYEVKWDGYRALALKHNENVRLLSLREKDLTHDFPSVSEAVQAIQAGTALIDGEVVAVDSNSCPSFQALQNRASLGRNW